MITTDSYSVNSQTSPQLTPGMFVLFSGESQTKPLHKLGPKVYDYYLIHYVISGKGRFHCRGCDIPLSTGDSFLIEPEQLVSYISDEKDPWHYRWIAFSGPH